MMDLIQNAFTRSINKETIVFRKRQMEVKHQLDMFLMDTFGFCIKCTTLLVYCKSETSEEEMKCSRGKTQ